MSNLNNYKFARELDQYKAKEIDVLAKNVDDATKIMDDPNKTWTPDTRAAAQARYDQMKERLARLKNFHAEGMELVKQHEALTNKMSKIYDSWWKNISNEGRQETELMQSQADILNELMGELYKELLPLNLPDMKPPTGMNL